MADGTTRPDTGQEPAQVVLAMLPDDVTDSIPTAVKSALEVADCALKLMRLYERWETLIWETTKAAGFMADNGMDTDEKVVYAVMEISGMEDFRVAFNGVTDAWELDRGGCPPTGAAVRLRQLLAERPPR
jgi:hypothetical protein